ncbi:MAG: MotA/TolQ/ExbB proton channel family protein [Planctomycetota bacterium]
MWASYLEQGGPLMIPVLAAWIVVLAGVIDRIIYAVGRGLRRPAIRVRAHASAGSLDRARDLADKERSRSRRGIGRIDSVSQLATSVGLFGTVVGIARGFVARGGSDDAAASLEGLAAGLSTALFTTIGGLVVFLFGQLALIVYREWLDACERGIDAVVGED